MSRSRTMSLNESTRMKRMTMMAMRKLEMRVLARTFSIPRTGMCGRTHGRPVRQHRGGGACLGNASMYSWQALVETNNGRGRGRLGKGGKAPGGRPDRVVGIDGR